MHNRCRTNRAAHYWSPLSVMGHTAVCPGGLSSLILDHSGTVKGSWWKMPFLFISMGLLFTCSHCLHLQQQSKWYFRYGLLNDFELSDLFWRSFATSLLCPMCSWWSPHDTSPSLSLSYFHWQARSHVLKGNCPTGNVLHCIHLMMALS